MLAGDPPQLCGMNGKCSTQCVIESNGDVYPCDFYTTDKYLCGNLVDDSFNDIIKNEVRNNFLNENRRESNVCSRCHYRTFCHQNCKRLNITMYDDEMCGYQQFLDLRYTKLKELSYYI